jgi:flavin reductase (DIM6/NTAB) family NADH-FMN oxidoreductase RutF
VSIHSEHPFATPEHERSPLRRFRGRMPLPVSVWTAERAGRRAGWTVSSMLVADGEPPVLLGLVDEDSALADLVGDAVGDVVADDGGVAVSLLGWAHRGLADAFAGIAPAPGGPFRLGSWTDTTWGPVLADAPAWLGGRLVDVSTHAGWSLLLRAEIEHVEIGPDPADGVLAYLRGRYRALDV